MDSNLFNPKVVQVRELEKSNAIVLTIKDGQGNDVNIFFQNPMDFFKFAKLTYSKGTYGIKYDIETGEKAN